MFYPWKFLWPVGLSPLYEWLGPADLLVWRFLFPTLAFALVTAGLVAGRRRWPGALPAWGVSALVVPPGGGAGARSRRPSRGCPGGPAGGRHGYTRNTHPRADPRLARFGDALDARRRH